jgi:hypothetical protein
MRAINHSSLVGQKFVGLMRGTISHEKMLLDKRFGLLQSFFGEHHGPRFIDFVTKEAPFVEPIQYFPFEALPRPVVVVQGQVEKCESDFVDCVGVDVHSDLPSAF